VYFNVINCILANLKFNLMKKLLLSIAVVAAGYSAQAQVVLAGVSPAAIQGNYDFSTQVAEGIWPGETDDGTWGVSAPDFNIPGTFIQDTLMLVEDGQTGTNDQGNPVSQEGCDPLINDLSGKIAVIYRNTCSFVQKVKNAQDAGAIAAIIVNREDALVGMLGDATDGPNVTIPAVFVSNITGNALIAEMQNGPVVMFLGNKIGAFANDAGSVKGEFLVSTFGGQHSALFDTLVPGIQVYNYGTQDQPNMTVQATIDGPSGNVYDQTVATPLNSGDTAFVFPGNATEFPAWDLGVGGYTPGNYTLTYTVSTGGTDDFPFDNVYTSEFTIQDEVIASSRVDGSNMPIGNSYPGNSDIDVEMQSCMVLQDPNASSLAVRGLYFVPHADTSVYDMAGSEIFVNAYTWDDPWTDIYDAQFDPSASPQVGFDQIGLFASATYIPQSNNETNTVVYADFGQANYFQLVDNQRYLFCVQTFEPVDIQFGYDNANDHGANYSIFGQPNTPLFAGESTPANTWYPSGWSGGPSPSIALRTFDPAELGVYQPTEMLEGNVFPNPANDVVNVAVTANGAANITVTDISGKVAISENVTLENGKSKINIESLESGVYIINVTTENGQTATFNVVKK
jgi:hypothetical protein